MAYIGREPLAGEVILLNSIESQFNGVLTTFNLTRTVSGATSAFYPIGSEQLLVSLGGVIQRPDTTGGTGFRISFNTIIFAVAPTAGTSCFIVAYGNITDIGSPANNTVTTEKLVDGAVTPVKLSTGGPWWLSNGNVGIGTNSPSERLHIHAPGTDLAAIRLSGTAVLQTPYNIRQGIVGVSNAGLSIYDVTAAATRFAIDSAGNIGIGTGNPTAKLDVRGWTNITSATVDSNWNSQLLITGNTTYQPKLTLSASNGYRWSIRNDDPVGNGELKFRYEEGSFDVVTFTRTGNVGVGVTNPSRKLDIQIQTASLAVGSVLNSHPIAEFINLSEGATRGLEIGSPAASVTSPVYLKVSGTGNRFAILNQSDSEQLTILNNGNVGIGTTNPASKLDVAGTVTATNFADATGGYNVNLGSSGSEGRGLVAGYSGGSYGGIGYNVRHTTTGGTYIAPMADTSNYLVFNQGFTFLGENGGSAGRTLSYNSLARLDSSGNFLQTRGGSYHRIAYSNSDNSYSSTQWWNGLALGNNGDNYIVAGRTNVGGQLKFYVNNTNDITSNTTPGGTLALTLASNGNATFGGTVSASQVIGGNGSAIGSAGLVVNGTVGDNDSQLILKKPSQSSFGVLAWDGAVYLSANAYYENGGWVQSSATGDNNNQLFALDPGGGVRWYASNNGSGSWNVASDLQLWTDAGNWNRPLTTNVTYNGNTIWHAGNDGAGSGLDADLLDGNNSSYFLNTSSSSQTKSGNLRVTAISESWAEGVSVSVPSAGNWGGYRLRRERGGDDGNWAFGYTALDSTDDLVFVSNNGGVQVNNILRLTKTSRVGVNNSSPLQTLDVRGNFLLAANSTTATHITQKPYTINNGTLSWEGSAGQLFSITNNLTTGSIFSVNDVSGIPSIDVDADGTIKLAPFNGTVAIKQITETSVNNFNTTLAPSSGTLTIDVSVGTVILGDLNASVTTWAFTNVPTTNNRATTITLIIDGDTSQTYGEACSVNGSAITGGVKWAGGSAPPSTDAFDIISFTIVKDGAGTINVFGSGNTNLFT